MKMHPSNPSQQASREPIEHRNRARIEPILAGTYGAEQMRRWWVYWRVFFMSCAELWGYAHGREWLVSHYLFSKPPHDGA